MATYEDIERVNKEMTLTPIKNKNYAEVPQKINAFRKLYPNGSIVSEIISLKDGVIVMKATVYDEAGNVLGTGHAYEVEGSNFINKTSFVENCETSAWGRALSACGIAGDAVASYEEVANAKLGQEQITKEEADSLVKYAKSLNVPTQDIVSYFNVKDIKDLTKVDYAKATRMLNDIRRNK